MNLAKVLRLIRANPAIALGAAAFAGFALGSGALPIPALRLPSLPTAKPKAAEAAPSPPPDPLWT